MIKSSLLVQLIIFSTFSYAQNTFPSNGNVGIGAAPLSGGNAASWLTINGTLNYSGGLIYTIGGAAKGFSYVDGDGSLTQQAMGAGQKFIVNSTTTAMSIAASGNVGFGITNPLSGGNAASWLTINGNSYSGGIIYAAGGLAKGFSYVDSDGMLTQQAMGTGQKFIVNGTTTALSIAASGNIGIGTTDPKGYKLAVAGNMIAEQVTVKLQGSWPDYVFRKNYTLTPLSEVKTYIDQNHHLPDIPSEQQVQKEGLNLGEMNAKLLKKIEELTLYMIEKDKELKNERSRNDEQQIELLAQKEAIGQILLKIENQKKNNQ